MAMERMEQVPLKVLFRHITTQCRLPTKALPIRLPEIIHPTLPTITILRILNIPREAPTTQTTPTEAMAMISGASRDGINVHETRANGVRESSIIEAIGTRGDRPPPIVAKQDIPTGIQGRIGIKPIARLAVAVVVVVAVVVAVAVIVAVTTDPVIILCMKEESK